MKLSNKILYIQQRADKTLSFGWKKWWWYCEHGWQAWISIDKHIIWHPMDYGRLQYLYVKSWLDMCRSDKNIFEKENEMVQHFMNNERELTKNVLSWSEDTLDIVISFLDTLPKE